LTFQDPSEVAKEVAQLQKLSGTNVVPRLFSSKAREMGGGETCSNLLMEAFDGVLYDLLRDPVDKTVARWWGRPVVASPAAAKFASRFGLALGRELARILAIMFDHSIVHGDLHFSNVGYKVVAHRGAQDAAPRSRSRSPRGASLGDYAREPSTFVMEAALATEIKLLVFDFDYEFGYGFGKVSVAEESGAGDPPPEPTPKTQMRMEVLAGNVYDALKVAHALSRAASAADSASLAENSALCREALAPVLQYA
ncbi:unnamed protein product, partial [marine sediment metagenome]